MPGEKKTLDHRITGAQRHTATHAQRVQTTLGTRADADEKFFFLRNCQPFHMLGRTAVFKQAPAATVISLYIKSAGPAALYFTHNAQMIATHIVQFLHPQSYCRLVLVYAGSPNRVPALLQRAVYHKEDWIRKGWYSPLYPNACSARVNGSL